MIKHDVIILNNNKYDIDKFINLIYSENPKILESKYKWWDRVLNTEKFKCVNTMNRNYTYEETKIQLKNNILRLINAKWEGD